MSLHTPSPLALTVGPVVGVARRNLSTAFRTPSLLLPPVVAPVIFLVAFSGGLSVLADVPEFDFSAGYVAFEFAFVVLQGAIFTGIFSGLTLARDFDTGVALRFMTAARDGRLVVLGYVLTAVCRAPLVTLVLFALGLTVGMRVGGGPVELLGLLLLSELLAAMGALWSAGIALRFRTVQSAPLMQFVAFLLVYLTPVFTPLALLDGWFYTVAALNPFTALVEFGRGLMEGEWVGGGEAVVVVTVLTALLLLWVDRGVRRLSRSAL